MANNCIFSWTSRKQAMASTPTAEAEFYTMNDCAKEAKRIRQFMAKLRFKMTSPTNLYCDNLGAQTWTDALTGVRKAKHVEISYHYV